MLQSSIQLYRNAYTGLPKSIWWLSLVIFVNRCGTMVIPFLTVYLVSKGFTLEQAGYIMGAFGVGAIVGSYLGGRLTDSLGYQYVQIFSLVSNGILFILLGYMQTLWQIGICIFVLSSLGEAFRPANAAAVVAYSDDTNRTRCYSLNRLAINLGWSIGPAIGGILASINYILLFWVDGLTCLAAALLLYKVLPPAVSGKRKETTEVTQAASAYKDPVFLQAMAFLFLIGLCFFQLFTIIPVYYKEALHYNEALIGVLLALNGIIIVLVEMVLVYKLDGRPRHFVYLISGTLLMGISFLVLTVSGHLSIALLNVGLVTFGEMLFFPFMNNFWVKRSTAANRGQYAAVYAITFAIANVLAPTLASQLAVHKGYYLLWLTDFVCCGIAAAGFFILRKKMFIYE